MSPTDHDHPHSDAGLCAACRWTRLVPSARGQTFYRCGRSDTDPRYPRYPALPVLRCPGFDRVDPAAGRSTSS